VDPVPRSLLSQLVTGDCYSCCHKMLRHNTPTCGTNHILAFRLAGMRRWLMPRLAGKRRWLLCNFMPRLARKRRWLLCEHKSRRVSPASDTGGYVNTRHATSPPLSDAGCYANAHHAACCTQDITFLPCGRDHILASQLSLHLGLTALLRLTLDALALARC
jgi:hypothetical protein